MDSIEKIAISHIADILANKNLIPVKKHIWKTIFYNSGQSELFNENKCMFKENINVYDGINEHSEECYSALQKVFSQLMHDNKGFIILLNNIVSKINMYNVFEENIEKKLNCIFTHDILEYLKKKDYSFKRKILEQYPSRDFKKFRDNLNLLGLDIIFDKDDFQLTVIPFSITEKTENKTVIKEWLECKYPNILISYESAIKAYGIEDEVGTLTHCRNIITGIFTYSKNDKTKWYTGLQKACIRDKNIGKIKAPINIISWKNGDTHNDEKNLQYNYPRFKTIAQVYSFLCDLGDHINEAPLVNGKPDYEITTLSDAFMGLRMTEDILIWLYKNQQDNL